MIVPAMPNPVARRMRASFVGRFQVAGEYRRSDRARQASRTVRGPTPPVHSRSFVVPAGVRTPLRGRDSRPSSWGTEGGDSRPDLGNATRDRLDSLGGPERVQRAAGDQIV